MAGEDEETTLRAGKHRPLQKRRIRHGWTKTARRTFLDHMAATCNVTAACEAAGMSQAGAYQLRGRDAVFADEWRAALLSGYDRLEAELLRKAIGGLQDTPVTDPDKVAAGPVSVEQAIRLLAQHRTLRNTGELPGRGRRQQATEAETDALLAERLNALRRRRETRA